MNLMVTYLTDKFSILQEFWRRARARDDGGAFHGTDKSEDLDLGGLVQVIDWNSKQVKKELSLPTPAGFDYDDRHIYLATDGKSVIIMDKSLQKKRELTHDLFNDIHGLNLTGRGVLVSSTGLDTILEVSQEGVELFRWVATEHGYNSDPKGRLRVIDQGKDHRNAKYPTLQQTTHLNSALYVGDTRFFEETIYASLFHQGEIIAIDRKTGEYVVVMSGLNHPHSVYQYGSVVIFSDSENQRVVITDKDFKRSRNLHLPGTDWIQDTTLLSNGNLLVCDSNNHRLLEVDLVSGGIKDVFEYSSEYKIYQAKELR